MTSKPVVGYPFHTACLYKLKYVKYITILQVRSGSYTHSHTHACVHIYAHRVTHRDTDTHRDTITHTETQLHTQRHNYTHTRTHAHIHIFIYMHTKYKPLAAMALSKNPLLTVSSGQLACICCTGTGGSNSLASDFTAGNCTGNKCK